MNKIFPKYDMLSHLKKHNVCNSETVTRIRQSTIFLLLCISQFVNAQSFTPNRLVVLRTAGSTSSTGSAVTLVEFPKTGGSITDSVNIPNSGTNALQIATGASGSEGFLTNSIGKTYNTCFLTFAGYNASGTTASIASTSAATFPRAVCKVDPSGIYTIADTSKTAYSTNDIRASVSDGTNFWASGALASDGIDYFNSSPKTILAPGAKGYGLRIFNGNIYYSCQKTNTFGIYLLGTGGFPTTAVTLNSTPIINTGTATPQDFSFNAASNICYIAIDLATSGVAGVQKWTKSGSTWSLAYTLTTGGAATVGAYGLVVDYSGTSPVIYATTTEAVTAGNRIVKITDNGSAGSSTVSTIVTATANKWYHGITFTPCATKQSVSITTCASYTFNSTTYTSSGTYNATFTNKAGCDSIVTLNLTITPANWLGTTNTDWNTASNWCGGVPTSANDVIISGSVIPVISASSSARNITIQSGSGLDISGTNTLNIYGNWSNSGTFTAENSTVVFTGTTNSTLSGAGTTFYSLKVDKSANASLSITTSVQLKEKLSFGTTATNALLINNAGGGSFTFLSDANTTAHVDAMQVPLPIITGNFICQKYFPAQSGRYSFMLGVPVTNGFMNALQPTAFDASGNPTNGILITGPFTGTNTASGIVTYANSSFAYNPSTGLYSGYPVSGGDISTSALTAGQGYRFTIRDNATLNAVVAKTLTVTGTLASPGSFAFSGLINGAGTKTICKRNNHRYSIIQYGRLEPGQQSIYVGYRY